MPEVGLKDMPWEVRVRLDDRGEKHLWNKISEQRISEFAESSEYSRTQLYNWKNKEVFLPVNLVKPFSKNKNVVKIKAGGRSKPLNVKLPLNISKELLTRIETSVSVNREGVPIYYTNEKSLINRFQNLLNKNFGIKGVFYRRKGLELRFPKIVHLICEKIDFELELAAKIDEKGRIEDGKIILENKVIEAEKFNQKLYSKQKTLELALARKDSETVEDIISEQARKVRSSFSS